MEVMQYQLGIPYINEYNQVKQVAFEDYACLAGAKAQDGPVRTDGSKLFIAMADPVDFIAIEDARVVSGMEVFPMIAS